MCAVWPLQLLSKMTFAILNHWYMTSSQHSTILVAGSSLFQLLLSVPTVCSTFGHIASFMSKFRCLWCCSKGEIVHVRTLCWSNDHGSGHFIPENVHLEHNRPAAAFWNKELHLINKNAFVELVNMVVCWLCQLQQYKQDLLMYVVHILLHWFCCNIARQNSGMILFISFILKIVDLGISIALATDFMLLSWRSARFVAACYAKVSQIRLSGWPHLPVLYSLLITKLQ